MSKDNSFLKKLVSINDSIERNFNKINPFILKIKKSKFDPNNKAFLIFGLIIISILTFFSIPSFYDKNIIQSKIKNQLLENYKIEVKFNEEINFGLFPKPHFYSKNFSILQNKKEIAKVKKFKAFISNNNIYFFNEIKLKDVIFNGSEFNVDKESIIIFKELLETKPSKNNVIIKNSKIFYKNFSDEVLFILKIPHSKFFYDFTKLENNLVANNEIFNLPFKIEIKNNFFNKFIEFKLNSKKIRLNIENVLNYKDQIKSGETKASIMNMDTVFFYEFDKNSFKFISEDKISYDGYIDFKPFYLMADFNYENFNLKSLLDDQSILFEIIRSEIFKNENLNMNIDLNIENIVNLDQFNNLKLKLNIAEGSIDISNSNIFWFNDLKITIQDSFVSYDNENINLIGKFIIDFKNIEDFYRYFQVKKSLRKKINQIQIDFVYNVDEKNINLENMKINGDQIKKIEKFLEKFNANKERSFNKITFRNFVNNLLNIYSG